MLVKNLLSSSQNYSGILEGLAQFEGSRETPLCELISQLYGDLKWLPTIPDVLPHLLRFRYLQLRLPQQQTQKDTVQPRANFHCSKTSGWFGYGTDYGRWACTYPCRSYSNEIPAAKRARLKLRENVKAWIRKHTFDAGIEDRKPEAPESNNHRSKIIAWLPDQQKAGRSTQYLDAAHPSGSSSGDGASYDISLRWSRPRRYRFG